MTEYRQEVGRRLIVKKSEAEKKTNKQMQKSRKCMEYSELNRSKKEGKIGINIQWFGKSDLEKKQKKREREERENKVVENEVAAQVIDGVTAWQEVVEMTAYGFELQTALATEGYIAAWWLLALA